MGGPPNIKRASPSLSLSILDKCKKSMSKLAVKSENFFVLLGIYAKGKQRRKKISAGPPLELGHWSSKEAMQTARNSAGAQLNMSTHRDP